MFLFTDYESAKDSDDGKSRLVVGSVCSDSTMARVNVLEGVDADYIFSKLVGSKENLDKLVEDAEEKEESNDGEE